MTNPLAPLGTIGILDGVLAFYHYPRPHARRFDLQLKEWVANFDPERDQGERSDGNPRSSQAWFYHHNFEVPPDGSSPLGTYFGVERSSGLVVVMATLVKDDRGMLATCKVEGDYMWGLVICHHDHRRKGFGGAICAFIDGQTHERVIATGVPETHVLFTAYEPAVRIYKGLGYKYVQDVIVDDPGLIGEGKDPITEILYNKTYNPA